jgi:AcrR family transcriptional regulator
MPRSPADNQRLKDERRAAILAAARGVFARKGLASTKISDLAAAAGLSHGLVYHYFESKEAVYAAIVESVLDEATGDIVRYADGPGQPAERLRAIVEHMLARGEREPETLTLVVQAFVAESVPDGVRARLVRFAGDAQAAIAALFAEGQATGEFDAGQDARELTALLFAAIHGLAIARLVNLGIPRVVPRVETLMRCFSPRAAESTLAKRPHATPRRPTTSRARPARTRFENRTRTPKGRR